MVKQLSLQPMQKLQAAAKYEPENALPCGEEMQLPRLFLRLCMVA